MTNTQIIQSNILFSLIHYVAPVTIKPTASFLPVYTTIVDFATDSLILS